MKNVICLIYDRIAGLYSAPMTFTNNDCAIRYFKNNICGKPNSIDLELYYCADYNQETGEIICVNKVLLIKGDSIE